MNLPDFWSQRPRMSIQFHGKSLALILFVIFSFLQGQMIFPYLKLCVYLIIGPIGLECQNNLLGNRHLQIVLFCQVLEKSWFLLFVDFCAKS